MYISELVSIIVPIYNAENNLERCINSLLKQSYSNIEIILVNDGSTDKSGTICERFRDTYSNIIYIKKDNGGVSSARNTGLENAHGDYIMFVDSDDYTDEQYCMNAIKAMKKYNADLVISGLSIVVHKNIKAVLKAQSNKFVLINSFSDDLVDLFKAGIVNAPYGKIFKKSLIEKKFDESISLGEDLLFTLDYLCGCKSVYILDSASYMYVCDDENSLSQKFRYNGDKLITSLYERSVIICDKIWPKNIEIQSVLGEKCLSNLIAYAETVVRNEKLSRKEKKVLIKACIENPVFLDLCKNKSISLSAKQTRYLYYLCHHLYILFYFESNLKCKIKKLLRR